MFNGSPVFVRMRTMGARAGSLGWLAMAPGLFLILAALAIIIWPQLLAYLVALLLLAAGVVLTGWGWAVRRAEKARRSEAVYYKVV